MALEFSCHACGDPEIGFWRDDLMATDKSLYECFGCFVGYTDQAQKALALRGTEKEVFGNIVRLFSGGHQDRGIYHVINEIDALLHVEDYGAVDRITDAFYMHNFESKYPVACFSLFSATSLAKELLQSRGPFYAIFSLHQRRFGNLAADELAYLERLK